MRDVCSYVQKLCQHSVNILAILRIVADFHQILSEVTDVRAFVRSSYENHNAALDLVHELSESAANRDSVLTQCHGTVLQVFGI